VLCLTNRWLLAVFLIAMTLGAGVTTIAVQAQDAGQPIPVNFVLEVDTSNPKLSSLCIGESFPLPITVTRRASSGNVGSLSIQNVTLTHTITNSSVVTATQLSPSTPGAGAPFRLQLQLKGKQAGSTTITLETTVDSATLAPVTFNVTVVPCDYKVSINSVWVTNMFGAETILIGVAHNLRLKATTGNSLQFDPEGAGPPFLNWTWSMNRVRGCNPGSGSFDQTPPQMRGTIQDDKLALSLYFYPVAAPYDDYWTELCRPYQSGQMCSERPDGVCPTFPPARVPGEWEPGALPTESDDLLFPIEGGIRIISHPLTGRGGPTRGPTIIRVEPVRVQQ